MAKYKTFVEVLEAFTGNHVDPEKDKISEEESRRIDEMFEKLEKLSPEERKKLLTPKPGDIGDDFII